MKKRQQMVIMDYSSGTVTVIGYNPKSRVPKKYEGIDHSEYVLEKWCKDNDIRTQDCEYMAGEIKIIFQ